MSVRGKALIISQSPIGKHIKNKWVQNLEGCSLIVYSYVLDTYAVVMIPFSPMAPLLLCECRCECLWLMSRWHPAWQHLAQVYESVFVNWGMLTCVLKCFELLLRLERHCSMQCEPFTFYQPIVTFSYPVHLLRQLKCLYSNEAEILCYCIFWGGYL